MIKKCIRCNRERMVAAKGLCASCYVMSTRDKKLHALRNKIWQKNHLEYWREYHKKKKVD